MRVRVGWGVDVHRLGGPPPLVLAGVTVDPRRGVVATSDGDVVAHAVADALLGAARLGDLGSHFPSSDPRWRDADSIDLLRQVVSLATDVGVTATFVDVTVIAEEVRVAPHRAAMATALAAALGLEVTDVSVKATTTDGLGLFGRGEGLGAVATVTVTVTP